MAVQPYAALDHVTAPTLVESDGHVYFMCGAPIPTVGWVVVNAVDHACVDKQQDGLSSAFDEIVDATRVVYDAITSRSTIIVLGVILFVAIFATVSALTVAKHIVDPLELSTKRMKSLSGDMLPFTMKDDYRTGDEVEDLAESFTMMSAKLLEYLDEVKHVTAQQERMSAELRVATDIQASQLPSTFPDRTEFDLFALMDPAKGVGGDFYDFFFVDHDHIALLIADVSSKEVPAALFMIVSRLLLKSHIQNGESLSEALSNVNDQLSENNNAAFFVTVWAAVIDLRTGEGTAVNAGHEHPALRHKDKTFELVVYRHSCALGLMEGMPFPEHTFKMDPGDTLFVYTDGVPEATNAHNELFGTERMLAVLNEDPDAKPETILDNVLRNVDESVGDAEQFDDLTMLCFKYLKPTEDDEDV